MKTWHFVINAVILTIFMLCLPQALFAGEQHGFRKSETAQRALEAELLFFGTVLLDGPVCV